MPRIDLRQCRNYRVRGEYPLPEIVMFTLPRFEGIELRTNLSWLDLDPTQYQSCIVVNEGWLLYPQADYQGTPYAAPKGYSHETLPFMPRSMHFGDRP